MSITSIFIALIWGVAAGYALPRVFDSLLGLIFCLHGLLLTHWKRLASKAATGIIRPATLYSVIFWVCLPLLLFGSLLKLGHNFSAELGFYYHGIEALVFTVVASATGLSQLPAMRRRLVTAWKMSHEYDYAERRKRTRMLRF